MNGDCDERTAAKWLSSKVAEGYTRFLLVVMLSMKQIRSQDEPVLSDWSEDGFDIAFKAFKPIIQGSADADVDGRLTQEDVVKTVDFCLNAYTERTREERQRVLEKLQDISGGTSSKLDVKEDLGNLTEDELKILYNIRAKQMLRLEDLHSLDHFSQDAIDGFAPNLQKGKLGLVAKATSDGGIGTSKVESTCLNVDMTAMVEEDEPMAKDVPLEKKNEPIEAF